MPKGHVVKSGYRPVRSEPAVLGDPRWVGRLANLAKTLADARAVLRRQASDWEEGFGSSVGSGGGGSSANADPVGARVVGVVPDANGRVQVVAGAGLAAECLAAVVEIDQWIHAGHQLARRVLRLLPLDLPVAQMLAKHAQARFNGAGECAACGDWVEGVDGSDGVGRRVDSGMCPTDAQQWRRTREAHHLGAVEWATRERGRRRLADIESAGRGVNHTDGVILRGSGGVVRPEPGPAAA